VQLAAQLRRDRGAAHLRHPLDLADLRDRHDPRDDRHVDARRPGPAEEVEVAAVVEEQLGDQEIDTGSDLLGEMPQIVLRAARMDVRLGEAGGADRERVAGGDQLDELTRVLEAALRLRPLLLPGRRIAPQGQDVVDPGSLHLGKRGVELGDCRADAGEVCHRLEPPLLPDPLDDLDRLLPGRAARTVGDRDEGRLERAQLGERRIQVLLAHGGLRREELEGEDRVGEP